LAFGLENFNLQKQLENYNDPPCGTTAPLLSIFQVGKYGGGTIRGWQSKTYTTQSFVAEPSGPV